MRLVPGFEKEVVAAFKTSSLLLAADNGEGAGAVVAGVGTFGGAGGTVATFDGGGFEVVLFSIDAFFWGDDRLLFRVVSGTPPMRAFLATARRGGGAAA